jgi:hypothetical protein
MGKPAIAEDGYYRVTVMWLDGISLDSKIKPEDKRYVENKRKANVHSKGYDSIWAATVDASVNMIQDGNYLKLPQSEKSHIVARIQSWILVDSEQGQDLPNTALPVAAPKLRLRPGQHKPKSKAKKAKHPPPAKKAKAPPTIRGTKPPAKKLKNDQTKALVAAKGTSKAKASKANDGSRGVHRHTLIYIFIEHYNSDGVCACQLARRR